MKIVMHTMEKIADVEIFPIISFFIFFIFFIFLGIYVLRTPKKYVDEMSNLPLDDNQNETESDILNL